eukprot:5708110-Prymnesium_polylepis.2
MRCLHVDVVEEALVLLVSRTVHLETHAALKVHAADAPIRTSPQVRMRAMHPRVLSSIHGCSAASTGAQQHPQVLSSIHRCSAASTGAVSCTTCKYIISASRNLPSLNLWLPFIRSWTPDWMIGSICVAGSTCDAEAAVRVRG